MNEAALDKNDGIGSINTVAARTGTATMTPAKGLLVLVGVVAAIAVFIALNHALGVSEFWVAFLFLLYWSTVDKMQFAKLPECIAGAFIGLLLGYLMKTLPILMGSAGGIVFLGIILLLIYGKIMHWLPLVINMMTMLFLTVATIPALQAQNNFAGLAAALALGIGYFASLIAAGNLIKKYFLRKTTDH